ncbi:glycosyltransferase [Acidisoma cellulosilytica]|uniref:Glycosyltransferase n=1 Tax=Acidisoma cellulosilyticum TaxID=2802395 RepID=A0A963Z1P8_9PROT|nr:glycosyltransferase [Acidisoma cellulosilyticum]MCB8880901.1 glycosyltransferase [Acidisoma cellulosilyticum]
MSQTIGIGVVTYNRQAVLFDTLKAIAQHTGTLAHLIVADDGSMDDTRDALQHHRIPFVTGETRGMAWNKNRALFWLAHVKKCDHIIILEDNTGPQDDGWEKLWIDGARRYGHVNLAGHWFEHSFISGSGSAEDPILSLDVSGQCSAFSREAILFGGLLDTRFKGFGFEHVEHTIRLIRLGYGGRHDYVEGELRTLYYLLKTRMTHAPTASFNDPDIIRYNQTLCHDLLRDMSFRSGMQNEDEIKTLRAEMGFTTGRDEQTPSLDR